MDHTYVDEKSLKTLEDLAVILTAGVLSLMTMQNIQVQSIQIGIMKEDMNERANVIIWDLRRMMNHYKAQLEEVLQLLPPDFQADETIKKLMEAEKKKARIILKKTKNKEVL